MAMRTVGRRGRYLLWALLAAALVLAGRQPGGAQAGGGEGTPAWRDERGEFDVAAGLRHTTLPGPGGPVQGPARAAPSSPLGQTDVRLDALTGSASRVRRAGRPLTGPSQRAPLAIARDFLLANRALFRLTTADVRQLEPVRQVVTRGPGVLHLTLRPRYAGIPVRQAEVKFDLRPSGELLAVSGATVPELAATVNTRVPRFSPAAALRLAARAAEFPPVEVERAVADPLSGPEGAARTTVFGAGDLYDHPPVLELAYLPTAHGVTRLAWETTLWRRGAADVFHLLIDAVNGQLLYRNNLTDHAQGLVFEREAPQDGSPFPGGAPPILDRLLQPFDGAAFFLAGDPHRDWWAGAPATATDANNAAAGVFRDLRSFLVAQAPGGDFSFPLDLGTNPVTYQAGAVTNLFYWINRCHDIWYGFGFDEAAGNFQELNFGLGGQAGDPVLGAAQFGAGANPPSRDNANFTTPPDGQNGVMRMFEFSSTNPLRDSDLAADVIAHEFGHGLTNRIIGNGGGLNGFQGGALGEGWSDFQSLMIHARPEDDLSRPHPVGGYLVNDFAQGIRSQPYSANRADFNRTFGDIGQEIPGFGPEIHLAGEIICNALFQAYGRLVGRIGFVEGRRATMQLFVDACKLCPANPTYLDFRDAMLDADQNRFAGANTADLWFAFAAHGMGVNARTTGVNDLRPVEDFSTPGSPGGVPAAPSNFSVALADADTLNCFWTDNAGDETHFLLEVSVNDNPFEPLPHAPISADSNAAQVELAGFAPGDVLRLRVRAANDAGPSPASNSDTVVVPGGENVPAAPTDFETTLVAPDRFRCTWSDNASNERGFRLEISLNLGPWEELQRPEIPRNATSVELNLTDFQPGDLIGLRVRAFNAAGESLPSNYDAVTLPVSPQPPAPPRKLTARPLAGAAGRTGILLAYRDRSDNEDGFRVELSEAGSVFQGIGTVGPNARSVDVTGLLPNTNYAVRIRAFNPAGESAFSNVARAKTRR